MWTVISLCVYKSTELHEERLVHDFKWLKVQMAPPYLLHLSRPVWLLKVFVLLYITV